jgi:hypothetical protein
MSYQAGMMSPPLMVTPRAGACGNTKRTWGSPSKGTMGSKSWPLAPSPCIQSTVPAGTPCASISTQGRTSVIAR